MTRQDSAGEFEVSKNSSGECDVKYSGLQAPSLLDVNVITFKYSHT